MDRKEHWQRIYTERAPHQVSWYQARPEKSLELIRASGASANAGVIDVGGGASTLVDQLLQQGFKHLTVLDISAEALRKDKERLGVKASAVTWVNADITTAPLPPAAYGLWHDRAVFHFLTDPEDRKRYKQVLEKSLQPGGHVIMATFALDGPPQCSGLEVARYSPPTLATEFGPTFRLLESAEQTHQTPFHTSQKFIYARFQRSG
jgi:SAM-dependent methyltransferase